MEREVDADDEGAGRVAGSKPKGKSLRMRNLDANDRLESALDVESAAGIRQGRRARLTGCKPS